MIKETFSSGVVLLMWILVGQKACCACSRYGRGLFGYFFSSLPFLFSFSVLEWSGGSMVLGELSVPGRPTHLESRERAYLACSRCGWGLLDMSFLFFLPQPINSFSLPLADGPI